MERDKGYLLPDGDCYTDEVECMIVFVPAKTEYRRALLGSLHYLATWIAWEKDAAKRGKDAARAWKDAFDLTMECWTMGCFVELREDVSAILEILQNKKDCCDDSISYYPAPAPTTEIDPGTGDPPEFYGETEVEDWPDWSEHVCYNAQEYVDSLKSAGDEMANAAEYSIWYLGLVAAALALLSFSGIGLPVAFALASTTLFGLLAATSGAFSDSSDDIEDAREDIVCALLWGEDVSLVIKDALGDTSEEWLLFFQFVDYDSATAIIYNGGADEDYLPSETDDSCVCVCRHVAEVYTSAPFTLNDADSDGANWDFGKVATGPLTGFQVCQVRFNYNNFEYCGPMKHIDTIAVDDALKFTKIITYDQDNNIITTYYDGDEACDELINQLNGDICAMIYWERSPLPIGCAQVDSTITVTYHDEV